MWDSREHNLCLVILIFFFIVHLSDFSFMSWFSDFLSPRQGTHTRLSEARYFGGQERHRLPSASEKEEGHSRIGPRGLDNRYNKRCLYRTVHRVPTQGTPLDPDAVGGHRCPLCPILGMFPFCCLVWRDFKSSRQVVFAGRLSVPRRCLLLFYNCDPTAVYTQGVPTSHIQGKVILFLCD